MFFDFHTHNPHIGKYGIYNFRIGVDIKIPNGIEYFTAGIHPWDVENIPVNEAIDDLKELLNHEKCVGLGEIGLDKLFGTNLGLQIDVLKQQIELYQQSSKKVLIIHCVKSYQEIIEQKNFFNDDLIWVLHAFNGSSELIDSLRKAGFYFSLGNLLFNSQSKISKSLFAIPVDYMFFETDEGKEDIREVYAKASEILKIPIAKLENQIQDKLKNLFPFLNG